MDWAIVGSTIATGLSTIIVGGGLSQRHTRKRLRVASAQVDALEEYTYKARATVRAHNEQYHSDHPEHACPVTPLPPWMVPNADADD